MNLSREPGASRAVVPAGAAPSIDAATPGRHRPGVAASAWPWPGDDAEVRAPFRATGAGRGDWRAGIGPGSWRAGIGPGGWRADIGPGGWRAGIGPGGWRAGLGTGDWRAGSGLGDWRAGSGPGGRRVGPDGGPWAPGTRERGETRRPAGSRARRAAHRALCSGCGQRFPGRRILDRVAAGEADPRCPACGGILKLAVVLFGGRPDPGTAGLAGRLAAHDGVLLVAGSSLLVEPVASRRGRGPAGPGETDHRTGPRAVRRSRGRGDPRAEGGRGGPRADRGRGGGHLRAAGRRLIPCDRRAFRRRGAR
ncbi:hypothetical protein GCM10020358_55430 [Amorphoplanes nipponensis]|uniref:Uncharacterized protein n=1 Tax=Actinoplanes nipponensis TaxID=135950 RepID=A0A919JNB1_9ACTN|nr:hypothetical protein Ani05nite_77280 [Actinoplanes nipponensis]